jgi:hypothetical protein
MRYLAVLALALLVSLSPHIHAQTSKENGPLYICPMDADVRTAEPGSCPRCGMPLIRQSLAYRRYALQVTTAGPLVPGRPARLTFRIVDAETDEPVRKFLTVHERVFHLFVTNQNLTHFEHLHPQLQRDGSLSIDLTVPRTGLYQLYCDFVPEAGSPQLIQYSLLTSGSAFDPGLGQAVLEPQLDDVETAGTRVRLRYPEQPGVVAGELQAFRIDLSDAKTGQPVTDLEPFLGAPAHAFVVSEDLSNAVHSHPALQFSSATGPNIVFEAVFPRPGMYRMWVQFQRKGELAAASFTVPIVSAPRR